MLVVDKGIPLPVNVTSDHMSCPLCMESGKDAHKTSSELFSDTGSVSSVTTVLAGGVLGGLQLFNARVKVIEDVLFGANHRISPRGVAQR
jgi:hypothetical protein